MSQSQRVRCIFDFDLSLVNANTDTFVLDLRPDVRAALPALREQASLSVWTDLMAEALRRLHATGVTRAQLADKLRAIPVFAEMTPLLSALHARDDTEMYIVSDANAFFIDVIVDHLGWRDYFLPGCIFTNPCEWSDADAFSRGADDDKDDESFDDGGTGQRCVPSYYHADAHGT
jgi:pyridoxal phosphate phosphatase PHOSPHO2